MIGALEGDSFPWAEGESSIIIGTFEEGWGFPILILVPFLALKYIEACLFLFCFGLMGVLRAMGAASASLSRILGDTSSCSVFSTSFSPPSASFSVSVCSISSCSIS